MQDNKLQTLPSTMGNLVQITTLQLTGNPITRLPPSLGRTYYMDNVEEEERERGREMGSGEVHAILSQYTLFSLSLNPSHPPISNPRIDQTKAIGYSRRQDQAAFAGRRRGEYGAPTGCSVLVQHTAKTSSLRPEEQPLHYQMVWGPLARRRVLLYNRKRDKLCCRH